MGGKRRRPKGAGRGATAAAPSSTTTTEEVSTEDTNGGTSNGNKSSKRQRGKKDVHSTKNLVIRLAEKPGKLTKEDVMCPICWSTLFEPTTLPCNHSLCEKCLRKHVAETSLCCPCCRMRLSIWSRKAMKENSLLDEALWNRIKTEFPKHVEARILGEDSQFIVDDEERAMDSLDDSFNCSRPALDGTLCDEPGKIAEELQEMMRQHQKDMEEERAREETASASLIKQIQETEGIQTTTNNPVNEEEDFLLAKKLQEEEDNLQRSMRSSQARKSVPRNLVKEWISSSGSPSRSQQPKTTQSNVKQSPSTGKNSAKKNGIKKKPPTTPSGVSKASQDVMSKFLSSSQNQLLSPESSNSSNKAGDDMAPCCSKSLPVHDVRFSAFSPTKPSTVTTLIVPSTSLAIPISAATENFNPFIGRAPEELGTSTKTPDSINSEVDRHFRPIRGAPKTPPRRRQDGTFLPEPRLLRSTPIKPGTSASISAYICSPLKQVSEGSKPSCATMEKRISNDSGRASDDSRSPDVDGTGESPTASLKESENASRKTTHPYQTERGRISEDYRVTPEDNPQTPENSKKRYHDESQTSLDNKKLRVDAVNFNPVTPEKANVMLSIVKQEAKSPSLIERTHEHVPLSFDITCTQGIMTIEEDDEEYLGQEEEALKLFRQKAEQEAADRAFAEALQRNLDREERTPRGRNTREKYSLRSWLRKPEVKQEHN